MTTRNTADLQTKRIEALETLTRELTTALAAAGVLPHEGITDLVTTANATNEATLVALANALKAAYNAHIADTDVHGAADSTNAVSSANATNTASAQTLVNELKADFNAHIILEASHRGLDAQNTVATADGSNEATSITLANALKAAINRHFAMGLVDFAIVPS